MFNKRNVAVAAILAIVAGMQLVSLPSYATERGEMRRESRDTRQEGRQDARQVKQECRTNDDKSRAECRQDKRGSKQDTRENAREVRW